MILLLLLLILSLLLLIIILLLLALGFLFLLILLLLLFLLQSTFHLSVVMTERLASISLAAAISTQSLSTVDEVVQIIKDSYSK